MYDNILTHFISSDKDRPALMQPNKIGQTVYATDGHAVTAIPIHLLSGEYSIHEKCPPSLHKIVLAAREEGRDNLIINHEKLFALLNEVPTQPFYDDCKNCQGEGTIECEHCGYSNDCKVCNGSGLGYQIQGYSFEIHTFIKINGSYFDPNLIQKLVTIQQMIDMPILQLQVNKNKICSFLVGEVFVGIMPVALEFIGEKKIFSYDDGSIDNESKS